MKPFKTRSKPMLKNIVANWYGEIGLKILKEKPIKSIRIKAHLSVPTMYHGAQEVWEKEKKSFQMDFWKQGPIVTLQKFITTIWLRFHKIRFHNYLYYFILQPFFCDNKQFGVEFNMNSWIFFTIYSTLLVQFFFFKSPPFIKNALLSKNNYANVFIIKLLI